jgi:hypothetical protein
LASQMAGAGERYFAEIRDQIREAGMPRSRAKAKIMREFEVTLDRPQNHMAKVTIHSIMRFLR